jgi:hypothetical protein
MISPYDRDGIDFLAAFLVTVPGIILLFLLFRGVMLWYWKVNRIVSLLEDIKKNTSPEKSEGQKTSLPKVNAKALLTF